MAHQSKWTSLLAATVLPSLLPVTAAVVDLLDVAIALAGPTARHEQVGNVTVGHAATCAEISDVDVRQHEHTPARDVRHDRCSAVDVIAEHDHLGRRCSAKQVHQAEAGTTDDQVSDLDSPTRIRLRLVAFATAAVRVTEHQNIARQHLRSRRDHGVLGVVGGLLLFAHILVVLLGLLDFGDGGSFLRRQLRDLERGFAVVVLPALRAIALVGEVALDGKRLPAGAIRLHDDVGALPLDEGVRPAIDAEVFLRVEKVDVGADAQHFLAVGAADELSRAHLAIRVQVSVKTAWAMDVHADARCSAEVDDGERFVWLSVHRISTFFLEMRRFPAAFL